MARVAQIVGAVVDIDGAPWDVREFRATRHGFDVAIGWPEGRRGPRYGGPRVIATPEILAYWESVALRRDGAIYDLPLSRSAIKRLRRVLGLDFYLDNAQWWHERLHDLVTMTGVQFAHVHGVSETIVSMVRAKLIGNKNRPAGWWREPQTLELLTSDSPRILVADQLGIAIGTVGKLRWMARKELGNTSDDTKT